jgi:hypothetical protein
MSLTCAKNARIKNKLIKSKECKTKRENEIVVIEEEKQRKIVDEAKMRIKQIDMHM